MTARQTREHKAGNQLRKVRIKQLMRAGRWPYAGDVIQDGKYRVTFLTHRVKPLPASGNPEALVNQNPSLWRRLCQTLRNLGRAA